MSDYLRIELKGLDRLSEAFKKAPALVDREIRIFLHATVRHLETEVVERTPQVTGALRRSIKGEVMLGTLGESKIEGGALGSTPIRGGMLGSTPIKGGMLGVVSSNLDYHIPVELGSKPHEIKAKNGESLKFVVGGRVINVKSVHHPGSKGSFMFQRAFDANRARIEQDFEETVSRIVQSLGSD